MGQSLIQLFCLS